MTAPACRTNKQALKTKYAMRQRIIPLLCILLFPVAMYASTSFPFKKYQVSDGLSHNTVWSVLQDSYGFIWIGTSNGLNRFDGYTSRIYRHDDSDSTSLGNNYISALMENDGDIWVGTHNGIYIYRRHSDSFEFFNEKTRYGVCVSCDITKIWKSDNGLIWITTLGQGLFVYNPQTKTLKQNILQTSFAKDICQGADGRVYVSSLTKGIFVFDRMGYYLTALSAIADNAEARKNISCLLSADEGVWFSSGNILECYSENGKTVQSYPLPPAVAILSMMDYGEGYLLIGTNSGLWLFDRNEKKYRKIESSGRYAMSDPAVNAMMKDAEGTLWVATDGGVNYMPRQLCRFEHHVLPGNVSGNINTFCERENGEVYIGTQNGLWLYNPQSMKLSECPVSYDSGRKYNVSTLLLDGDWLWIGTHENGMFRRNLRTGATRHYTHSDYKAKTLPSDNVMSVYKDLDGNVHIGTSMGFCTYSRELDNFHVNIYVGAMTSVTDICEDADGRLWVATLNLGLFCSGREESSWKHFEQSRTSSMIPDNTITTLFKDSRGVLWAGTNGKGICRFSKEQQQFISDCPENGQLKNATIYSIEEDADRNFWVATDKGLYKLDRRHSETRLFTANDGLPYSRFVSGSSLSASDGRLYFGGDCGFNAFLPGQIHKNDYLPQVYVTDMDFLYSDEKDMFADDSAEPLYLKKEVRLPYNRNSFTLRFAALSYGDTRRNQYDYIMEGLDPAWVRGTTNNSVTYNHLPPGTYTFMLNGTNNDGKRNPEPRMLKITVTPPWWMSSWAVLAYLLFFAAVLVFLGYKYNLYVRRKYKRRMEEFNLAKEKETYKLKFNFFVNLVHEIRTPLSLICLPLEKLREKNRNDEYVEMIDKNVNYLLNITNQLLDFQKIESDGVQINPGPFHLNVQLASVYEQFHDIAALKRIDLSIVLPEEDIHVSLDMDKVRTIVVNLMGNAMKYTRSRIVLKMEAEPDWLRISVTDDGCGVPEDQQEKIFQLFYQVPGNSSQEIGTGIGLAFSRVLARAHGGSLTMHNMPEGGASFILSIPRQDVADTSAIDRHSPDGHILEIDDCNEDEKDSERIRMLLVEDNDDLRNMICKSLKRWYDVESAGNGRIAMEILEKDNIDIIVSDVMMPEMDGIEFCRFVKSHIEYSHIPLVLLTAKTTLSAKLEGLENGADVYMEKPFTIKQLHQQIENLFTLRLAFHRLLGNSGCDNDYLLADPGKYAFSAKDADFIRNLDKTLGEVLGDINYSVELLAERFGMSRSSFHRKVKAVTGMTPNNYVMNYRLNLSVRHLREGMRINEVALELGFSTSSYFAKCFKSKFGVLPKDYLKSAATE